MAAVVPAMTIRLGRSLHRQDRAANDEQSDQEQHATRNESQRILLLGIWKSLSCVQCDAWWRRVPLWIVRRFRGRYSPSRSVDDACLVERPVHEAGLAVDQVVVNRAEVATVGRDGAVVAHDEVFPGRYGQLRL